VTDIYTSVSPRRGTPQTEQADPRQVVNSAGGFTFTLSPIDQLRRFLILGTDAGTFYVDAKALTKDNAKVVIALCSGDDALHKRTVDEIVEISTSGRAPRANPAIFALAIAASIGSAEAKRYALSNLGRVCRTGTHLFTFATYVEQFRGWGRGLRAGVAEWYLGKDVDRLAYQMVKYRQRDGWTHRDLLRLAHPETEDPDRKALFDWVTHGTATGPLPLIVHGYEAAKVASPHALPSLIEQYDLPWEALPTDALTRPEVWGTLFETGNLPLGALLRNLPRLTNLGLLPNSGGLTMEVAAMLTSTELLRRARIHPVQMLIAQRTYAQGHSEKGSSTWSPNRKIFGALNDGFYEAFGAIEPTGKRFLLALDISGSMGGRMANLPLSAREGSAAMALTTVATEPECDVVGFTSANGARWSQGTALVDLNSRVDPSRRLDDVIASISGLPFGRTDCALPLVWAKEAKRAYDAVVIYTDNETWHGQVHPHEALRRYRERMGLNTALIVVGMTSTGFTIADPSDARSLDVVGFDTSVPGLIADFVR
jgi:60 kDa SS-A/Ro ribonucleoprotein